MTCFRCVAQRKRVANISGPHPPPPHSCPVSLPPGAGAGAHAGEHQVYRRALLLQDPHREDHARVTAQAPSPPHPHPTPPHPRRRTPPCSPPARSPCRLPHGRGVGCNHVTVYAELLLDARAVAQPSSRRPTTPLPPFAPAAHGCGPPCPAAARRLPRGGGAAASSGCCPTWATTASRAASRTPSSACASPPLNHAHARTRAHTRLALIPKGKKGRDSASGIGKTDRQTDRQ